MAESERKRTIPEDQLVEANWLGADQLGQVEAQQRRRRGKDEVAESQRANASKSLGDILLEADLLSAEELGEALEIQLKQGKKLNDVLAEQEMVTPEQLATALSIQLNMPLIDLKRHTVQPNALKLVPEDIARKYMAIPLDIIDDVLLVVMADPTDIYAIEDIQARAKTSIEPMLGVPSQIEHSINYHYSGSASAAIEKQISKFASYDYELAESEGPIDLERIARSPVAQTFDLLVSQAISQRASDIHVEPQENRVRIRYRIDGILHDTASLPPSALSALSTRIKVMAGMDIAEQRRPQDGQFSVKSSYGTVDIRVASAGTAHGERLTLRLLEKERTLIPMEELGFSREDMNKYKDMLRSAYGMIMASGPTGSGKTTTLYASIAQLDRVSYNIMTIEDPIEYDFDNISQLQVNLKAGITFPIGLRMFVRHDPDIILVGEVRDGDTANIAAQSALTGHLVLSSIHANDTIATIFRMIDLGVEPYLIAATLVGSVAQRMVRRICPNCAAEYQPSEEEREAYESEMGADGTRFYKGKGCNFCNNTGFLGRIGVYEVQLVSDTLRQMLVDGASAGEMKAQAVSEGLRTMRYNGMLKVKHGITTPAEVIRTVFSVGQR
ncbi:MAG: GspE/PulE family protein [Dehalococcoidia bacterium]